MLFILSSWASVATNDLSYDIKFLGFEDTSFEVIASILDNASLLKSLSDDAFISLANLPSNINADGEVLEKNLRSEGYYYGLV